MPQTDDAVTLLDMVAKTFGTVDRQTWDAATGFASWRHFLDCCKRVACADADDRSSLSEFLEESELEALHNPPTFQQKQDFAAQHFTGGLPQSAQPIESLYRNDFPALDDVRGPRSYGGLSAQYMADLVASMNLQMPPEFQAYPDHLALEADMAAVLYESGDEQHAQSFIEERFTWLTEYRMKLLALQDVDARFYIALLDVLMGLATGDTDDDLDEASSAMNNREEQLCQNTQ